VRVRVRVGVRLGVGAVERGEARRRVEARHVCNEAGAPRGFDSPVHLWAGQG
jgi:hypothetical protein